MSSGARTKNIASADAVSHVGALQNYFAGAVLVVDCRGRIVICTPQAKKTLQLKSAQSPLPAAVRKLVRECLDSGAVLSARMISRASKNGHAALSASATPVRRGRATEVVVILQDLSSVVQWEDNLCRLDRLASIGALSASSGHEIKNALVAVKTFIDLLLAQNRDAELAEVVQREMQRIDSIVSDMLKFSRPARPTFSAVRLHDVLDHSLRLVQHQLDCKLISLNRSYKATSDAIKGDDYQLEQLFVNLFINAVEAMGPNGSLKVSTELIATTPANALAREEKKTSQLRVTISDTGMGVPPEHMAHLFEPFFTTKHNGTGLGLPITRRIVQEHYGVISVQSELNKGTTFSILLPATAKTR